MIESAEKVSKSRAVPPLSKSVHLEEISYCPDSCDLFERIRDLPRAVLLDSSHPYATGARYEMSQSFGILSRTHHSQLGEVVRKFL